MCVNGRRRHQTPISLPSITPLKNCKLKLLRLERVDDWLLLEREFIANQKDEQSSNRDQAKYSRGSSNNKRKQTKNNSQNLMSMLMSSSKGDNENDAGDDEKKSDMEKIDELSGSPMIVGTLEEFIDDDHCIVSLSTSDLHYYVRILSFVDRKLLKLKCSVLLHPKAHHIVGVLDKSNTNRAVNAMKVDSKPKSSYSDIGGLETQIQEIKETVELPLTHPELFEEIGIPSPSGVILYGPPGTGKSLLAQAVANATKATFIHLCGSELVQATSGSGPKLVKQLFDTAKELQPSIIFIDEIDAIGSKRYNARSSGEKAIQRTMMQLLQELQGFDDRGNVKIIMATNKIENLDSALIRAGRIDRKIECPLPDIKTKLKIFKIHTRRMKLKGDTERIFKEFINDNDDLSGADIKAICTEAGLLALRERRMMVTIEDFEQGKKMLVMKKNKGAPDGMYL
mmetsp:Transcript_4910/g.4296  ORF Transcript_4910/g.4296 Transcript_4910/m.4296 type:complete len:454 (-) Transcript_4910:52-1413(-)|eukprot:CAMPEP_0201580664 /NCGR_PEP_ID=MMETSP0190_2-20130828/52888_1 /ASSEMBLY_ACC=CAM_ASM_000263 /TAXON_ID=37353 /ORGANISM="Rosalina sp." /LENGTH=453 /DNA_ID=CAMNT_0048017175 /DNA_START=45 /DNA_END=1406 /DNA_ORIENTATION=+